MRRTIATVVVAGSLVTAAVSLSLAGSASAEDLLSGLRTEEVEASVLRVVGDGFRDLPTDAGWRVEAGRDGSVWLLSRDEALRLGREPSLDLPEDEWQADLRWWRPTPDGGLSGWASNANEEWFVASFDEPGSQPRTVPLDDGLEPFAIMPDGRAWAQRIEDAVGMTYALWRLADARWVEVAAGLDAGPQVSADGDLWLGSGFIPFQTPELRRFEGGDWVRFPAPERTPNEGWTVGPDGSVWTWANYRIDYPDTAFLARMRNGNWSSWEREDLPPFADMQAGIDTAVAPDGALWVAVPVWASTGRDLAKSCRGVSRFDGATLSTYLEDHCVHSLSIGPDGSVWLRANEAVTRFTRSERAPVHTYVIAPSVPTDAG